MQDLPAPHCAPITPAPARQLVPARKGGTQAVVVVCAANMMKLRRQHGRRWAEQVGEQLAPLLADLVQPERIAVTAVDRIELDFAHLRRTELDGIIRTLVGAFTEPWIIGDISVSIEPAIGAALSTGPAPDELALVEEALAACAQAVVSGNPVVRPVGHAPCADRSDLSDDLKKAVRTGELRLCYQPKMHLRHRTIAGLEALVRWQHPTRGLIMPGDFIPLAEQNGEIAALTSWVLDQVVADQRVLLAHDHRLPVYINVAGALLTDQDFVERASALVANSTSPIGFEITETSVIRDPDAAIANLNRFASLGIPIAIDDYGAGLSSLAYLKQLPARELKIDKLFVTQLTSSNRDPLIVRSTIDLAHALEMEVVAEGIESATALALLSVMGCDLGQGYFIGRPTALSQTIAFLDRHREGWTEANAGNSLLRLRTARRG